MRKIKKNELKNNFIKNAHKEKFKADISKKLIEKKIEILKNVVN